MTSPTAGVAAGCAESFKRYVSVPGNSTSIVIDSGSPLGLSGVPHSATPRKRTSTYEPIGSSDHCVKVSSPTLSTSRVRDKSHRGVVSRTTSSGPKRRSANEYTDPVSSARAGVGKALVHAVLGAAMLGYFRHRRWI